MIIELLAQDFAGTDYGDSAKGICPIEKAGIRQFNTKSIVEAVGSVHIDGQIFEHPRYTKKMYEEDYKKAQIAGFDETKIREIEIQ